MKKAIKALALAFAVILGLSACGAPKTEDGAKNPPESAKTVTEKFLKAVKDVDTATIAAYMQQTDENREAAGMLANEKGKEIRKLLFSKVTYKIDDVKEDGANATADITLQVPDYTAAGKEYSLAAVKSLMDQAKTGAAPEEASQLEQKQVAILQEAIGKLDGSTKEIKVTLKLQLVDNVWKVVPDQALFDQITGNFYASANSVDVQAEIERMSQELIDYYASQAAQ